MIFDFLTSTFYQHTYSCIYHAGGTIAGVSVYLKERNPKIKVFLADPPGSSFYLKVKSSLNIKSSNAINVHLFANSIHLATNSKTVKRCCGSAVVVDDIGATITRR